MSINDFSNKIKGKLGIDTFTIICLFVIVGVGIASFSLGRLSVVNTSLQNDQIVITDLNNQLGSAGNINSISDDNDSPKKEKRYVASKNGKLYYSLGCSGAKRILVKNQIWFSTAEEAEKSGYQLSSSCK